MRKYIMLVLICGLAMFGCARTWEYPSLENLEIAGPVPPATECKSCHEAEYDAWKRTEHSEPERMSIVPRPELRECAACHDNSANHVRDPQANPQKDIVKLSKTEQNNICGKCHYNQEIFGFRAINPHDRHGLLTSTGLEGRKNQLSCLDCHSGHHGKSEMLVRIKPHICFKCHTEAIVTMGVFQPFNYLFYGKACQACHAVHGGSGTAQWSRMGVGFCVVCHFTGVAVAGG